MTRSALPPSVAILSRLTDLLDLDFLLVLVVLILLERLLFQLFALFFLLLCQLLQLGVVLGVDESALLDLDQFVFIEVVLGRHVEQL